EYQKAFPCIFRLAMDVLPVQGTLVPCERAFSSAKSTTTDARNQLGPELMEALQVLKYLWRSKSCINFTAHLCQDQQLAELKAATALADATPTEEEHFKESLRPLPSRPTQSSPT
ncbi:hypothetical protein PQX77_006710, partial [Marasmius sp. AFHP31]